eukprot:TRINITY_DN10876_c0_g1_i1.p1 TRINITY_DN10876_c0_g1~~TRINITY_DN10876_c0_g1_i1.p1  ORF type:complete len:293 (-),score=34.04 TRINITY_DN10876_c0_g1_i1:44-922(-)
MKTYSVLTTIQSHSHWVYCCSWSPSGYSFVSGSSDGEVKVWKAEHLKMEQERFVGEGCGLDWDSVLEELLNNEPLPQSLQIAVQPLKPIIPHIEARALICQEWANTFCSKPENLNLNPVSVATIHMYTLPTSNGVSIFGTVNNALRDFNRTKKNLKEYMPYVKLLNESLRSLPDKYKHQGECYRGTEWVFSSLKDHNPSVHYPKGKQFYWYAFQSSSCLIDVADRFCNKDKPKTIFHIEVDGGFEISDFSYFKSEKEVLFPLLSRFEVVSTEKRYDPSSPELPDIIKLRQLC